MMYERRDQFIKKLTPLGYEREIIDSIINKRIAAPDFKLMAEKIGKAIKRREARNNRPIEISRISQNITPNLLRDVKTKTGLLTPRRSSQIRYADSLKQELGRETGLNRHQLNKIMPLEEQIYTRDEIPDPNSEWLSKNHKSYKISLGF
jgi:hypothetical protein